MKEKIQHKFLYVASIAILATMLLVAFIFYDIFQTQVIGDLKTYSHLLKGIATSDTFDWNVLDAKEDSLRVTVVSEDGTVIYDNYVSNISTMDNHAGRREIQEANKKGEGFSIRRSDTLSKNSYYYAIKLSTGDVLRVSKEASSILGVLIRIIPMILLITAIIFVLCILFARLITKRLIAPIEDMAAHINEPDLVPVYEELVPFVNTIRSQHEDILKSAKVRQEFTANVSHELKTPLTSISGYAELMENGMAQGDDIQHFAKSIHQNADRLLTLINDIIRLSELDSSQFQATYEEIDLFETATSCVELLQMYAENHHVTMSISGNHQIINANKQMLDELIYNLCDNAIRYNNPGGRVDVSVYRDRQGAVISVKDTGIGISKEHQERIFERFYRVDKSRSKATGGTGLGLAIVKHIAMQHQARLELNSEVGKGTEIKVIFVS